MRFRDKLIAERQRDIKAGKVGGVDLLQTFPRRVDGRRRAARHGVCKSRDPARAPGRRGYDRDGVSGHDWSNSTDFC